MMKPRTVSIICAVHNEEQTIPLFYNRINPILNKLNFEFEIIFTNNRSTDNTLAVIQGLMGKDPRVKVLTFSRNFGYQASIQAGMVHAQGECMITIDVDCEDPPELIPVFLKKWEEGNDIVYGKRKNRPESRWLIFMRNLFYRILRLTADTEIVLNMAEFGLISYYVRDGIVNSHNTFPFLRTEIAYSGFKRYGVEYDREKRIAGETHYNFWRMLIFAIGGILSSSTFLFRFTVYILPIIFFLNIVILFAEIYTDGSYFKSIVVLDLLYLIWVVAFHGIYIARIYKNSLCRPIYIVDWKLSSAELKQRIGERGAFG
jgi:polyisoprenyl-phosphate glycosyltransferase